jgi:hypothetical protein
MGLLEALQGMIPTELRAALEGEAARTDVGLIKSAYGEMYISSSSATATDQTPNFTKVAGTYTSGLLFGFSHATGTLTYIDPTTRVFLILVMMSMDNDVQDTLEFRIVQGSTEIAKSEQHRLVGAADVGIGGMISLLSLAPNDTIEVHVARQGAPAVDMTMEHMGVIALPVGA